MSQTPTTPVRVVFIAGTGRSGSTIISNVIGQLPGALAVGEARYTWGRGAAENQLCGCGRPFDECPMWQDVMARVRAEHPDLDPAAIAERIDARLRVRDVPLMELRRLRRRPAIPPHRDDAVIASLYRALAAQPGVDFVVDSSKLPPYAMLVDQLPGIELLNVHVVRDPRATSFSWRRSKVARDANAEQEQTMPQIEHWRSGVIWTLWNGMVSSWWPPRQRMLVRYEDFVADPQATVRAIAARLGVEAPRDLISEGRVHMAPTHSVAGNPDRLDHGSVALRADTAWRTQMPLKDRVLVGLIALPALHRFGYHLRTRRR